eukprot:m.59483 g.59483  ORF g.59483 m.59483 type:complete len:147 (+) comp15699_c0_seq6:179-619(+)
MQKLVALSAAGGLFLTKPSKESFRPFLQKWAVEVGSQNRDTSDNGGLSNFLRWANNQLEDLTLAATAGLSTIEIVDAGVCMVASAMVPNGSQEEKLFFIGVAGHWYFVPKEVLDNGLSVAAYTGMAVASVSVVNTAFNLGRRLLRR